MATVAARACSSRPLPAIDQEATPMPDRSPLDPAQRTLLSTLAADRPNATPRQLAKIFQARTGRRICWETAKRAKCGMHDGRTDRYHLSPEERETIRHLIRESAPDYGWAETARAFEALTGRPINYQTAAKIARGMGITARLRDGAKPGATARTVERNAAAVHAVKLANAPYRPGYFAQSDRSDYGGYGVRVHKATGPARDLSGGDR